MLNDYPQVPSVLWQNNTNSNIPSHLMPSATVSVPQQVTPNDVAGYLDKMDFTRLHTSTGEMWRRRGMNGYMTWEQAVVYCLVKPWLVDTNYDAGVQTNA